MVNKTDILKYRSIHKKKPKKKRIEKSTLGIAEIKKHNITLAVSYSEKGNTELYTDFLKYFEIEKPNGNFIEVRKITIIANGKIKTELEQLEAEKLILLLDDYNNNTNHGNHEKQ